MVGEKFVGNKQQDDKVRAAEFDFLLGPETLMKGTAAENELIELQYCLDDGNKEQIPENVEQVAGKLTHRWRITIVDESIIILNNLRYKALNLLHVGYLGIKSKMWIDENNFRWLNT